MKVLIVDDNKNNRMILNLLLEEYASHEEDLSFEVTEAADGVIALEAVKKSTFDLIFMDIMMPNMDGIAATSAIRRLDKKAMIIAVSAVDDNERKKVILNSGAEDYISKPVNGDIFEARLQSYIKLIRSRHVLHARTSREFNLFEKNVYSYHMHFYGENEDMLSSFWEYYLLGKNTSYEGASDVVRFIYGMGLEALEKQESVNIYEENDEKFLYITLETATPLNPDTVMLYAEKNNLIEDYKFSGIRLSVKLLKNKVINYIEIPEKKSEPSIEKVQKQATASETASQSQPKVAAYTSTTKPDKVFDFLDSDDFEDLKDYISKLNSLLLILGSSKIEPAEVDELVLTLYQISRSIGSYPELFKLGACLGNLGNDIGNHKANFIAKSMDLGPLAKAFGGDLSRWFKSLFIEGAPSIEFLDDSIISNAQMIGHFINPEATAHTAEAEDLDDIFDF